MSIQQWSENIVLAKLENDPQFTDDLNSLLEMMEQGHIADVILDFSDVEFLNSSNIAKLLKLRKLVTITHNRHLKLCGISSHIWGIFLVTGLDKILDFTDEVSSALTELQLANNSEDTEQSENPESNEQSKNT